MKNCSLPYVIETTAPAPEGSAVCGVRRDTQAPVFPARLLRARLALAAIAFLCLVAMVAAFMPARRAASIEPMQALRME